MAVRFLRFDRRCGRATEPAANETSSESRCSLLQIRFSVARPAAGGHFVRSQETNGDSAKDLKVILSFYEELEDSPNGSITGRVVFCLQ